uniref:TRAF-type domain-containing protein n=1 Tax=Salix viminalis TaxID=40686 RepID=A0A6N2MVY8_SALVM
MDLPASDVELVPENEKIEDGKERGHLFHCELYDTEIVRKIGQIFLPGLSSACVDNTTGDMFRSPGSVAVDVRKEMIDYLTQRSESFVAESVVLEGGPDAEVSDHPYDIISVMVDDFASLKRSLFGRVSGWLLSEKREDKIDDFIQEMETNGFWLLEKREAIAQILVKNVDYKNIFHCDKKFNTVEELAEHVVNCGFRTMNCTNEGCTTVFCASQLEKHDSACPFKIIPCEQQCSENIMRREMDRHCITVCLMKIVNCPFYVVGCQSTVPQSMVQQHHSDNLHSHLLNTLKGIHEGALEEDLKRRVDQIVELSSGQLADDRDVRSLILKVKDLEAKLGPLEVKAAEKFGEESNKAGENGGEESIKAGNKGGDESAEVAKIGGEKFTGETNVEDKIGSEKSTETINKVGGEFSSIQV